MSLLTGLRVVAAAVLIGLTVPGWAWNADAVLERIAELPEVTAFAADLAAQGGQMLLRLDAEPEPDCRAGAEDCVYLIYVGEDHPDHTVLWRWYQLDPADGAVSVSDGVSDFEPRRDRP